MMEMHDLTGLIAPVLALLFAMTFIMVSVARNNNRNTALLGSAFILIAASLYVPWAYSEQSPMGYALATDTLITLSIFPIVKSLLARHKLSPAWWPYILVCTVWLAVSNYLIIVENDMMMRCVIGSFVTALLLILLLRALSRAEKPKRIDRVMFGLLALTAALMVIRSVLTLMGSDAVTSLELVTEIQWTLFNVVTVFTLFVLAMTFLAACVIDIVSEFESEARKDALTGLMNRLGFETSAQAAIDHAKANKEPLSLIVCDVDNFKSINDEFGHVVGDMALIIVGKVLNSVGRSNDPKGRIGGEEFAVLTPNTTFEVARLLAESMRAAIAKQVLPDPLKSRRLTASFGVASWREDESYRCLFARADAALYLAKHSGKNCVKVDDRRSSKNNTIRAAFA